MMVRIWHGRTPRSKADEYARFLAARAVPDYRSVPGNIDVQVLRRDVDDATHFLTVTRWSSEDAVCPFAGAELLKAKYYPEDREFLLEFEPEVQHFELVAGPTSGEPTLSADRRFQELCTHIVTTDEVSFKLLGLVPLISGAGIAAVILKSDTRPSGLIYLLSLFAAIVTLALLCWERRNIQICKWVRDRAADLEADALGPGIRGGHFVNFPHPPLRLGKTEAEKVVYAVSIAAWLLLPWVLSVSAPDSAAAVGAASIRAAYVPLAWIIATAALALVVMPVKATPGDRRKS